MYNLIENLKTALQKHALYVQTRDEIAHMPLDIALDLGIFRGDANRIAYNSVYGARA